MDANPSDVLSQPDVAITPDGPAAPDLLQPDVVVTPDRPIASDAQPQLDAQAAPDTAGVFDGPLDASVTSDADASIHTEAGETSSDGGESTAATLFVPDYLAGQVYRYTIRPNAEPVINATIVAPSATAVALSSAGELFVAGNSTETIYRFLSPFGLPTAHGVITGVGLGWVSPMGVEDSTFVDDELWVTDPGNSNVVRLSFDSQGQATVAGTLDGLAMSGAILWDPTKRIVYITQSFTGTTIWHYRVAADHSLTELPPITGVPHPESMVVTAWGELLVGNFETNTVSRFLIDAQGNATSNGTITGNGLSSPAGLALAPWGELFVSNENVRTISRFTFDSAHQAIANGVFAVPSAQDLDRIRIFPAPLQ